MVVSLVRAGVLRHAALLSVVSLGAAHALGAQALVDRKPSALERTVDPSIHPGDDFFAYANGAWLKATVIPAGRERWNGRDEIAESTRRRLATLLDDTRTARPGTNARKVADFRAAWLDTSGMEQRGLTPLQPLLDSIEALADARALTRFIGRTMRADVDPLNWGIFESSTLLGLSVERSIHGEKTNSAILLQGGLGMPDRDYYLGAEPRMQALHTQYREYVSALLALSGRDRADQRAEAVLALETAIARTHVSLEASNKDHRADTLWTRADFARLAPGIDWSAFLRAAGLGKVESIVAWQPTAITGAAALISSQSLETWRDYLRVHALDAVADLLPRAFAERTIAFRGTAMGSTARQAPRAQRAVDATQVAMGDAIGRLYAERHFPAAHKARIRRIINNVTAAFLRRVEASTWMTPASRAVAVAKLKALYVGIGYPDTWQDYSTLVINAHDPVGNVHRVADHNYRRALSRIGATVDLKEWWVSPQTVGAVLMFQMNAYDFSAALLQAPKFDATASETACYGAIGAIIGHDVTHFVDLLGAEYLADGTLRRWWTPTDSARYQTATEPLVQQFNGYRPFPDAPINGRLTLSENIADLAGLGAAFDAYRLSLGKRAADKAYVRQQDREFFIAFAQSWRTKMSDANLRAQLTNDHAPEMYRIATARNMDAWYEAFDVRPGHRLYLEPSARVRIW